MSDTKMKLPEAQNDEPTGTHIMRFDKPHLADCKPQISSDVGSTQLLIQIAKTRTQTPWPRIPYITIAVYTAIIVIGWGLVMLILVIFK